MNKISNYLLSISEKLDRFIFRFFTSTRLELFKVIISQLKGGRSLKKTIEKRIEKHHKRHAKKSVFKRLISKAGGSEMNFLIHVNNKLMEGESFSSAIKGGWVSENEAMLIESGGEGKLTSSLQMAHDLLTSLGTMKKTLRQKLTYPIVLFIVLFIMIFAFSFYMLPILTSLSDPEFWEGSALFLYNFCIFFRDNALFVVLSIVSIILLIVNTLSVWTGRVRESFDSVFPWSIYKEFESGVFLISLSTLMKSGMQLLNALSVLEKQSPRYSSQYISVMVNRVKSSESGATAINTHLLGELGDEIEDLTEMGNFQNTLFEFGENSVEIIINGISNKADKIKIFMMLLVFSFAAWGYGTFIAISQSITNNFS